MISAANARDQLDKNIDDSIEDSMEEIWDEISDAILLKIDHIMIYSTELDENQMYRLRNLGYTLENEDDEIKISW